MANLLVIDGKMANLLTRFGTINLIVTKRVAQVSLNNFQNVDIVGSHVSIKTRNKISFFKNTKRDL